MGQYNRGRTFADKSILEALMNIFTLDNFIIAVATAFVGHVAFDHVRKRL
jgi:hypothetical protein